MRSIAASLAGDHEAAARVELELPETGVCHSTPKVGKALVGAEAEAAGCCGGPAPAGADACCVADVEAKAAGEEGCGCAAPTPAAVVVAVKPRVKVPAGGSGCCGGD